MSMHKRILSTSIIFGLFLLFLAYCTNPYSLVIAENNLQITKTNREKNINRFRPVSENVESLSINTNFYPPACIFYNNTRTQSTTDIISYLTVIGNNFYLDHEPVINDLVKLSTYDISTTGNFSLRKEAAENLHALTIAIKDNKMDYIVSSGYRSRRGQSIIYYGKLYSLGSREASKIVAEPGFSEHELGSTVDIIIYNNKNSAGSWLEENSYKYGFIQSYPEGKSDVTGIAYEPWHYRYVGKDIAFDVKKSGLTLYEYLLLMHNYCLVSDIDVQ
jgi:LAS superfamily LD-carboxypeptidase LdcB